MEEKKVTEEYVAEEYQEVEENYCTCPKCGGMMGLYSNIAEVGPVCALYVAFCPACELDTTPTNRNFVMQEVEILKSGLEEGD